MAKQWVYEVTGQGPFPIDMLRYCGARPFAPRDSEVITDSLMINTERPVRSIRLVTDYHKPTPVEIGQWRSQGWRLDPEPGLRDD